MQNARATRAAVYFYFGKGDYRQISCFFAGFLFYFDASKSCQLLFFIAVVLFRSDAECQFHFRFSFARETLPFDQTRREYFESEREMRLGFWIWNRVFLFFSLFSFHLPAFFNTGSLEIQFAKKKKKRSIYWWTEPKLNFAPNQVLTRVEFNSIYTELDCLDRILVLLVSNWQENITLLLAQLNSHNFPPIQLNSHFIFSITRAGIFISQIGHNIF